MVLAGAVRPCTSWRPLLQPLTSLQLRSSPVRSSSFLGQHPRVLCCARNEGPGRCRCLEDVRRLSQQGALKLSKEQRFSLENAQDLLAGCSAEDQAEMREVVQGHLHSIAGDNYRCCLGEGCVSERAVTDYPRWPCLRLL